MNLLKGYLLLDYLRVEKDYRSGGYEMFGAIGLQANSVFIDGRVQESHGDPLKLAYETALDLEDCLIDGLLESRLTALSEPLG